jgi:hypothetical protein
MHRFLRRILHWRKENSRLIAYGTMKQFIPYRGIYVYERRLGEESCLVIVNGNNSSALFSPDRYAEVIGPHRESRDIISGRKVQLTKQFRLSARKVMIIGPSPALPS